MLSLDIGTSPSYIKGTSLCDAWSNLYSFLPSLTHSLFAILLIRVAQLLGQHRQLLARAIGTGGAWSVPDAFRLTRYPSWVAVHALGAAEDLARRVAALEARIVGEAVCVGRWAVFLGIVLERVRTSAAVLLYRRG